MTKSLMFNRMRSLRNSIQQKCLRGKHSFKEEIMIDPANCVTIENIIGGKDKGLIVNTHIYPYDEFSDQLKNHFDFLDKEYKGCIDNIPKDI